MKHARFAALLVISAVSLCATPVTLKRQEALDLYQALDQIQAGLTPVNTSNAADDINALKDTALALNKGNLAVTRLQQVLPAGPDNARKQIDLIEPQEAKGQDRITLELTLFEISPDEIKSANISPHCLALVRAFLKPQLDPPKK